jgi:cobalt/nickel transport protein
VRRPSAAVVFGGLLLVALVCAGVVSRYASGDPDGLTKVSEDHGFAGTEVTHLDGLFEYGSLSGVVGVLVVLALAGAVAYALRRRSRSDERV